MAYDTALDALMADTIIVQPTVVDGYGKRTVTGQPVSYKCHVLYARTAITGSDGRLVQAEGKVWLSGAHESISTQDMLTLPNGDKPPILMVINEHDQLGPHHTSLHFGSATGGIKAG